MIDSKEYKAYVDGVVQQALSERNIHSAVIRIEKEYPIDPSLIMRLVWNNLCERIINARWRLAESYGQGRLDWEPTIGFYGLSPDEFVELNQRVGQETVREHEALDAIRRLPSPLQYGYSY